MKTVQLILLMLLGLGGWNTVQAVEDAGQGYSKGGSETCNGCHDLGEHSPVKFMLQSPHGDASKAGDASKKSTPMAEKGCESCHGPSAAHTQSPTRVKPGISFGPKWTSTIAEQNAVCESCHKDNAAKGWQQGVHHRENLTCTTCHDLHSTDKVMSGGQTEVCTVCHKPQKSGIHHLLNEVQSKELQQKQLQSNHLQNKEWLDKMPPCAQCHNPHLNPAAQITLLDNRSEGCRSCHDLQAMQSNASVSDAAKTYHKAMARKDRTCIDCHREVAHVALDQIPAPVVGDKPSSTVTLFYPGKANFDWINSEHPGAQPFRQGRNCSQCHAGEQEAMGRKLATDDRMAFVEADVAFKLQGNQLQVTLSWNGSAEDKDVALMLDDGSDEEFTRAGCWATCHNDLPGMERNRGKAITKYLSASLKQQREVGRFAVPYDDATLNQMVAKGHYVELWRANLAQGKLKDVQSYQILGAREADDQARISASAQYAKGQWTVVFNKPLTGAGKAIVKGKEYTFGIAIHGQGQDKSGHWVSLPMTFGINLRDVDFAVQ